MHVRNFSRYWDNSKEKKILPSSQRNAWLEQQWAKTIYSESNLEKVIRPARPYASENGDKKKKKKNLINQW